MLLLSYSYKVLYLCNEKYTFVIFCGYFKRYVKTSTGLHRSCAALVHFSSNFDLILVEAVNFEFIVEKVWFGEVCFGLVWIDSLDQPCCALG